MAYATVYHVLARNPARGTYTATSLPNATQVTQYILESAAEIDGWLLDAGYDAPFDKAIASGMVASPGVLLLQKWNSIGAALAVELGAQTSERIPDFERMWGEVEKMLYNTDLPLPRLGAKAYPRQHNNQAQAPAFGFSETPQPNNVDL